MDKSIFFLWLNDTTPDRYYWSQPAQNWTSNFDNATRFDTRKAAEDEVVYADRTTKAEVVVQEMLMKVAA